jgi:hypothetical protein
MNAREKDLEDWRCEDQMDLTELIEQDVPDEQVQHTVEIEEPK